MKKLLRLFIPILTALILLTSCSPKPILRVNLEKNDIGYWKNGKAIAEEVVGALNVEAAYSHVDKENIFFDVSFENLGEERILIDPKYMKMQADVLYYARDPEIMILNQEMRESRRKADNNTLALVAGAVVVAGVVAAAASDGGGDSDGDTDYGDTFIYTDIDGGPAPGYDQYFFEGPLLSMNPRSFPVSDHPDFWRSFALRKTTLFAEERVRGLVGFKRSDKDENYRLIISIDDKDVEFDFKQTKHKP